MTRVKKDTKKLSGRQKWASMFRVASISYKAVPSILYLRIASAILDAVLPLLTTFFAAQTTSELARAYNGEAGAGQAVLFYVGLTALLGVITTAWHDVERYVSRMARYKLESAVRDQLVEKYLARNFYRDSPVVILDEPTSAIDALAESRIFKRLMDQKNKTIITISHRLSTVRRARRIYVMEQGRIVEEGTHAELVEARGAYYRLFESQLVDSGNLYLA